MEEYRIWREMDDRPVETVRGDRLDFAPYVDGLCAYVRECSTPVSVAIQGSWGCGKTSALRMVEEQLGKGGDVECVWFDAWQYSQFRMGDQMELTFMQHFIDALGDREKGGSREKAGCILKALMVGAARQAAGEAGEIAMDAVLGQPGFRSFPEEVARLKGLFRKMVERKRAGTEKRLVFFIDDLDRLHPVAAVRLLETLRVFFDCEGCVFLLAVDMEVVRQGVREKFGAGITEGQAERFFEKVVQVVFQLPTSHYRLDSMVAKLLDTDINSCRDKKWYRDVARLLAGGTPRGLKRLANAFRLNDMVAEYRGIYPEDREEEKLRRMEIVMVLSGIQLKSTALYDHIVRNASYAYLYKVARADTKEDMGEVMQEYGFRGTGKCMEEDMDRMMLFSDTLARYVENCNDSLFLAVKLGNIRQVVAMEAEEAWEQPESDNNCLEPAQTRKNIEDMFLYRRMDEVLSFYFEKKDRNADPLMSLIDCDYRYHLKGGHRALDWLFDIRFSQSDVFPKVCMNEQAMGEGKPWSGDVERMQRNLAYFYRILQERYSEKAYRNCDFTGNEFLVYSEKQAECLVNDLCCIR